MEKVCRDWFMNAVSVQRASKDRRASEMSRGHEMNGASRSQLAAGVCFAPDLQSCALTFCQFDHANSESVRGKQRHLWDVRFAGACTPVGACVPCVSPRRWPESFLCRCSSEVLVWGLGTVLGRIYEGNSRVCHFALLLKYVGAVYPSFHPPSVHHVRTLCDHVSGGSAGHSWVSITPGTPPKRSSESIL